MRFMLTFLETDNELSKREDPQAAPAYWQAWKAYMGEMNEHIEQGAALQEPLTATQVQVRDGKRVIHDGPFADTKEHLGGYVIIDVPDLDAALAWAAKSPNAQDGTTEVRPVLPMAD